ncbi:alpha/beta fold hydrolase [Streptococcus moroccensis]|uniref:Pimeloyl-ACP methyl ester carboxylesterase n=1 Tax=Streptococcus moroccensis TaxID=1451356 RepID=A0ABT9YSH7_9STRE|nr:alpha/beta hydrolase [Streptococcus moroccensis]MDQ0222942.1 pimeloyl-ACP methyl ester carboxylesterase [Streptococcus moroccensis]
MIPIYFLGGLGSNPYHAMDLIAHLPFPVTVLELPGHGEAFDTILTNLIDLHLWFEERVNIAEPFRLIGHSMGAMLFSYLASHYETAESLILLDGGYFNLDALVSLEDEWLQTRAYLEQQVFQNPEEIIAQEQQNALFWSENLHKASLANYIVTEDGLWKLNLNPTALKELLSLQRHCQGFLPQVTCPTLLISQTRNCPDWKTEMIEQLPQTIDIQKLLAVGHSPHTDRPHEVAKAIKDFLLSNENL